MTEKQKILLEQFAAGETDDTGWAVNDAANAALKEIERLKADLAAARYASGEMDRENWTLARDLTAARAETSDLREA